MVSIAELREIREREAKKLKVINEKLKVVNEKRRQVQKIEDEKQKIITDIKRIKRSQIRDKIERQKKAGAEIQKIKATGKKVGKKILDYLYALRGY